MSVEISKVTSPDDVSVVALLAKEIWTQHFTLIIGASQVSYMLDKFQSTDAINTQLAEGGEYYLAAVDDEWVGYTAIISDADQRRMMLGAGFFMDDFIMEKQITRRYSRPIPF
jgi:diamine N-acetyltransferase